LTTPHFLYEWNPKSDGLKAVKERLIAENLEGNGLQWFNGTKSFTEQQTRADYRKIIAEIAPQVPAEQREALWTLPHSVEALSG
jgi:hypothetical protein